MKLVDPDTDLFKGMMTQIPIFDHAMGAGKVTTIGSGTPATSVFSSLLKNNRFHNGKDKPSCSKAAWACVLTLLCNFLGEINSTMIAVEPT